MKLQPCGSSTTPSPSRPAVHYWPPAYLRVLESIPGLERHQQGVKEAAQEAYRLSSAELGTRAADQKLGEFLDRVRHRPAYKVEGWLQDYAGERLWAEPQGSIYALMIDQDFFGDFPREFTRELMRDIPGVSLKERVDTFGGFLGKEAFQHHSTKKQAFEVVEALHRQGWKWSQASRMLTDLAHSVPPGEKGQYWNGAHLVGDFVPQRLYRSERSQRYLRLLELGYHRDTPGRLMSLVDQKVGATTSAQRLEALERLTEANKPVWFEEPEKVLLSYQAWSRRVVSGAEPEEALDQACRLSNRLSRQVAEHASPVFEAFARLQGKVESSGFQQVLEVPGALTDLTEPMSDLHYRDRPRARTVHDAVLEHFETSLEKLEVSRRFDALLGQGMSPESARERIFRAEIGDADSGPGPEIEFEPGYLLVGGHQLPVEH